jgi:hypothetical protein
MIMLREHRQMIIKTPGEGVTSVLGYSMLSGAGHLQPSISSPYPRTSGRAQEPEKESM